ncbi:hypothetical protein BDV12DRAFT_22403 [Aspergillus spectabilis]
MHLETALRQNVCAVRHCWMRARDTRIIREDLPGQNPRYLLLHCWRWRRKSNAGGQLHRTNRATYFKRPSPTWSWISHGSETEGVMDGEGKGEARQATVEAAGSQETSKEILSFVSSCASFALPFQVYQILFNPSIQIFATLDMDGSWTTDYDSCLGPH